MLAKIAAATAFAAGAAVLSVSPAGASTGHTTPDAAKLTLAVFGDSPYGTDTNDPTKTPDTAELQQTAAFIDTINADPDVTGVVHVGDIHSGSQYCTEAYDRRIAELWTHFADPLVYTPGDNEWTDCHKTKEGGDVTGGGPDYLGGNPVENLTLVRKIFFPQPGATLGSGTLHVTSQAQAYDRAHPTDAQYVENVMWTQRDVEFVTVNIPGGSNNDTDAWYGTAETSAQAKQQAAEVRNRTAADLRWLDTAFAAATRSHAKGVVLVAQADMWDLDGKPVSHLSNYESLISDIAANSKTYGGPVLMLNGDSHVYRSDNPLEEASACTGDKDADGVAVCGYDAWESHPVYSVPNFHRIVVHGSTVPLEWLKLTVDPNKNRSSTSATSFGPFSWQREPQAQLK